MKNNKIKITLRDIVGTNGKDNTGALKELNFPYNDNKDRDKWGHVFEVDLDFIIRHGRYTARGPNGDLDIYNEYYKGSPTYMKYYNEGVRAFWDGKDDPCDNPHTNSDLNNDPEEYWLNKLVGRGYPWYDGYRETEKRINKEKYKLNEFQDEVLGLVKKYGLEIKYTDEYNYPYLITKDGFSLNFVE